MQTSRWLAIGLTLLAFLSLGAYFLRGSPGISLAGLGLSSGDTALLVVSAVVAFLVLGAAASAYSSTLDSTVRAVETWTGPMYERSYTGEGGSSSPTSESPVGTPSPGADVSIESAPEPEPRRRRGGVRRPSPSRASPRTSGPAVILAYGAAAVAILLAVGIDFGRVPLNTTTEETLLGLVGTTGIAQVISARSGSPKPTREG